MDQEEIVNHQAAARPVQSRSRLEQDKVAAAGRGALGDYLPAHSARADVCRRLGRVDDARASYWRALALTRQEPERRFLERRLAELAGSERTRPTDRV